MNDFTQPYTPEGKHPEDAIYEVKTLANKLRDIQEDHFERLSNWLNLTEEGKEFLFDYIYSVDNANDEINNFAHYLEILEKEYKNLIQK